MAKEKLFSKLALRDRVLKLLASEEEYGGPQSIEDVCRSLQISNDNSRSVLVRLLQAEKIERIQKGLYKVRGDKRSYSKDKPHYSG